MDPSPTNQTIHVSLLPSLADVSLVQAGPSVAVEWYVGSVATVWIGNQAIPSTSNLAAGHADFAYVGWLQVWLAAPFWAIVLLNRRMLALFAPARILPTAAEVTTLAARETILPGGTTGWIVKSRAQQGMFLPLLVVALALISIRPLINPDLRLLAPAGDALLFGGISGRLI